MKKVIAICPVVDWAILPREQRAETSVPSYAAYIRGAFGRAYRLSDRNWKKLSAGKFYNATYHAKEITAAKIMMFHAQDDPYVPYQTVAKFSKRTGAELKLFRRGGHLEYGLDRAEISAGNPGCSSRAEESYRKCEKQRARETRARRRHAAADRSAAPHLLSITSWLTPEIVCLFLPS